jgi:hypothetical protein
LCAADASERLKALSFRLELAFKTGSFRMEYGFKEGQGKSTGNVHHHIKIPLLGFYTVSTKSTNLVALFHLS